MNLTQFIKQTEAILNACRALKYHVRKVPKKAIWTLNGKNGRFILCYSQALGWQVIPCTSRDYPCEIEAAIDKALEECKKIEHETTKTPQQRVYKSRASKKN